MGQMTTDKPLVENSSELLKRVDLANSAVLVVDVQNDWCHENGARAKAGNDVSTLQNTVPKVEKFVAEARRYKIPIIHIGTTHSKWTDSPAWSTRLAKRNVDASIFLKPGTWGAEFYKVGPQTGDYVVIKHRYSAFIGTDLDLVLRSIGIRTLIMAGFASNICVQNTALHGLMNDYYVVLLDDCTATFTVEDHEIAMAYMGRLNITITNAKILLEALQVVKKE